MDLSFSRMSQAMQLGLMPCLLYTSNYQFWQQDNHPIELQSPKWINQKLAYIHLNPVRNGLVLKAEDYLYSSAGTYVGLEGFIEIELLELDNTIGYIDS